MLTTTTPVHQRAMSHSRHFLALGRRLGLPVRLARTPVYRCWKNAQIVRLCPTPVAPSNLPNWIHMSFRRSEIRSDQRISEEPKTWSDYPRVCLTTISH